MNADAGLYALVVGHADVALGQTALHVDGAADGFDYTAELDIAPSPVRLTTRPLWIPIVGLMKVAAQTSEPRQRALLVGARQQAVAGDVSDQIAASLRVSTIRPISRAFGSSTISRPRPKSARIDWFRARGSHYPFGAVGEWPPFAYFRRPWRELRTNAASPARRVQLVSHECLLRGESGLHIPARERLLPTRFLPFVLRPLSAQLRRPRPRSAASAIRQLRPSASLK